MRQYQETPGACTAVSELRTLVDKLDNYDMEDDSEDEGMDDSKDAEDTTAAIATAEEQ